MSILHKHSISLLKELVQCKAHTSVELDGNTLILYTNSTYEPTETCWIDINSDLFYQSGIHEIKITHMHEQCGGFIIEFYGNKNILDNLFIRNLSKGSVKLKDIEAFKGHIKLENVIVITYRTLQLEVNNCDKWYDIFNEVEKLECVGDTYFYAFTTYMNINNHIEDFKESQSRCLRTTNITYLPLLINSKYPLPIWRY